MRGTSPSGLENGALAFHVYHRTRDKRLRIVIFLFPEVNAEVHVGEEHHDELLTLVVFFFFSCDFIL